MSIQKQTCDLIIQNCSILTKDYTILENQSIAICEGKIVAIEDAFTLANTYTASSIRDGAHKLYMPGLVDAHMHTNQQLLRGRIMDELPMIWTRIMLPYESSLTSDTVELSAQLAALEMIKSGTTAFADAGGSFMDTAATVYLQSGLRGVLTYSTMDQGNVPDTMKTSTKEATRRTKALYDAYHLKNDGLLQVFFSLRSILSCSPELIQETFGIASELDTGVHAHMNEYGNEVNYCLEHFKMRPLEYLESLGVLGPHFLSAHSLMLSEAEKSILAQYNIKVAHCPFSNCGKAVPPTPSLLEKGITVALGTDGTAHGGMSLWNEMKIFRSVMNVTHGIQTSNPVIMPAKTLLHMATQGGSEAIKQSHHTGQLTVGYKADLIGINIDQPHLYPTHNLVNTLVESVNANDVVDMIVNGKLIMKGRHVLTLDEERILYHAKKYFSALNS